MAKIQRVAALTEQRFTRGFVAKNAPVIVVDAMEEWSATDQWNPDYLARTVGHHDVQVYDDLFNLVNITTLREYVETQFGDAAPQRQRGYVRAYTKFKDLDFVWADELFAQLAGNWDKPYFFPATSFAFPASGITQRLSPVSDPFPYKGLFVSSRGCRTRLHRDPLGTDAILCQFYGNKAVKLYHPEFDAIARAGDEFVDPDNIDLARFPAFSSIEPTYEDVLENGEILFIPEGWLHDVTSLSDSVSVTWNFVHEARSEPFRKACATNTSNEIAQVLEFFRPKLPCYDT
jgi:hypothetical protein